MCDSGGMAQTVSIIVSPEDRARLAAVVGDRNSPQKHVQRARIVLASSDKLCVLEVTRQIGASRPAVWHWQLRCAEQGVDGLLRDKTRKPGRAPVPLETVARPSSNPPGTATHWTGRAAAKAVGISLRAVQRIWDAHRMQPHRLRTFKKSNDPAFAAKVEDVVGLYMEPSCGAPPRRRSLTGCRNSVGSPCSRPASMPTGCLPARLGTTPSIAISRI